MKYYYSEYYNDNNLLIKVITIFTFILLYKNYLSILNQFSYIFNVIFNKPVFLMLSSAIRFIDLIVSPSSVYVT